MKAKIFSALIFGLLMGSVVGDIGRTSTHTTTWWTVLTGAVLFGAFWKLGYDSRKEEDN